MGHTLLPLLELFFLNTLLQHGYTQDAVLTLEPSWSEVFVGESVTFICDMREGKEDDWYYRITKNGYGDVSLSQQYKLWSLTTDDSGEYQCLGSPAVSVSGRVPKRSNTITLTVSEKPKATLTSDKEAIPVGGSVTLQCSVGGSTGWKYTWYRLKKGNSAEPTTSDVPVKQITEGGLNWCFGQRGKSTFITVSSNVVSIEKTVPNRASVTLEPNWPQIFTGETTTLRCEIQGGGDTEWEYEWKTNSSSMSIMPPGLSEYKISSASVSNTGHYQCKGKNKSDSYSSTAWSDAIRVTVSQKPKPVLTVSPSWLSPGASVSLRCKVTAPSAGWRFYWYKAVPRQPDNSYSYEPLPSDSEGTEVDSYIIHGPTHSAGYLCRAERGNPVYHTHDSQLQFVWSGDHPLASIRVDPNRVQHFSFKSINLTCIGNSTEWRIKKIPEDPKLYCSNWQKMAGSPCTFSGQHRNAVYWCEFGSGQFSNAINLTTHNQNLILESPVQPVTAGESVTLGCKTRTEHLGPNVVLKFYKDDKLIQSDTSGQMTIHEVSKLDEGFYQCKHATAESPQSWVAVKSSFQQVQDTSFVVPLIIGLVSGILLLILLLLLCCYVKSKDSCCNRSFNNQRTKQGSTTDQNFKSNKSQGNGYSGAQHGDTCIYESVKDPGEAENGGPADDFSHVTYAAIQLKNLDKKELSTNAEHEETVYSEVKPGTAAGP